jgi:hypothetical protein
VLTGLGEGVIQKSRILGGRGALGRFRDLGARDWRIQHFKQMLINHLIFYRLVLTRQDLLLPCCSTLRKVLPLKMSDLFAVR